MDYRFESASAEHTARLARELAEWMTPGSVIALEGDLGAGKTTFSQAFGRALGVRETISSPTFTIIKEYEGRCPFYHMDAYRLSLEEADELGLDEYFFGDGVTLVEWASRIEELLPEERLELDIARPVQPAESWDADLRVITVRPIGAKYADACMQLEKRGLWHGKRE